MSVKVIPDMTTNYVFHTFARNTGERNWPVVHREVSVTLFEDRGNKARVQSSGICPVSRDCWKIVVKIGASSAASSCRILHGMLSGPEAFLTLSPASNFSTPLISTNFKGWNGVFWGRIVQVYFRGKEMGLLCKQKVYKGGIVVY